MIIMRDTQMIIKRKCTKK